MSVSKNCPVCGSNVFEYAIDSINLSFLEARAKDGKINAAISLARIIWENVPSELASNSDSQVLLEKWFAVMQQNLEKQVTDVLKPIESFAHTFHILMEKMPDELKRELEHEFRETTNKIDEGFTLLRGSFPTFNNVVDAMKTMSDGMEAITKKEIENFKDDLFYKLKETLQGMGFPEPEQMKLLTQLVPNILPLLQELLRFQKVPHDKGKSGEIELLEELKDYFPEDDHARLGGSGETDILSAPKFNGADLGCKVVIESKKNSSGWSRSFLQEVRNHMKIRGERFAILAVDVMPKGANGFMIEPCPEGVILISSRGSFRVAYGALRAVLIALQPFNSQQVDLKKILTDKKIGDAINDALQYHEYLNNIRKGIQRIVTNAKSIDQNADDLDNCLKQCLKQLQQRINGAIAEFA